MCPCFPLFISFPSFGALRSHWGTYDLSNYRHFFLWLILYRYRATLNYMSDDASVNTDLVFSKEPAPFLLLAFLGEGRIRVLRLRRQQSSSKKAFHWSPKRDQTQSSTWRVMWSTPNPSSMPYFLLFLSWGKQTPCPWSPAVLTQAFWPLPVLLSSRLLEFMTPVP